MKSARENLQLSVPDENVQRNVLLCSKTFARYHNFKHRKYYRNKILLKLFDISF